MRVIAGKFRGRSLASPPEETAARPMTDRIKETIFNILGHRFAQPGEIPPVAVLDLFAGSGGMGIEAMSRGAASCLFVERDRRTLRALHENLAKMGLKDTCRAWSENVWTLRIPKAPGAGYGIVFLDPPYRDVRNTLMVMDLIERIAARLAPHGVIVFRHERTTDFPAAQLRGVEMVDDRTYGRMRILLLAPSAGFGEGDVARAEQVEEKAGPDDAGDDADGQFEQLPRGERQQSAADTITDGEEGRTEGHRADQQPQRTRSDDGAG